jgi:hypothetical protein
VSGARWGKPTALGWAALLVVWLAACSSAPGPGPSAPSDSAVTPRLVVPKVVRGSPGKGPLVISNPAPLPGGKIGSQVVVLNDRTLVIKSVTWQSTKKHSSILIILDLMVRNTSGRAIRNESTFFELIGPGGDTFSNQDNRSYGFYGPIGAHASRGGTIEFGIPAAAASSLYLLYRPEIARETVLTRLKVG